MPRRREVRDEVALRAFYDKLAGEAERFGKVIDSIHAAQADAGSITQAQQERLTSACGARDNAVGCLLAHPDLSHTVPCFEVSCFGMMPEVGSIDALIAMAAGAGDDDPADGLPSKAREIGEYIERWGFVVAGIQRSQTHWGLSVRVPLHEHQRLITFLYRQFGQEVEEGEFIVRTALTPLAYVPLLTYDGKWPDEDEGE